MNKLMIAVAVCFALSAPAAFAADEHHPDQQGAPNADADKQARKMQEHMMKMHEQMHKIMETKDSKERERLMAEQRKTMQEQMKEMRQMHGGMDGMMGPGKMGGDGKGGPMEKPAGK